MGKHQCEHCGHVDWHAKCHEIAGQRDDANAKVGELQSRLAALQDKIVEGVTAAVWSYLWDCRPCGADQDDLRAAVERAVKEVLGD